MAVFRFPGPLLRSCRRLDYLAPVGGDVPEGESPSGGSLLPLTNPAISKAPGINPIPEAELASPSRGHRCATSITPQLGYVVPAPQETSAHVPNFAGKRPFTSTAARAYRQSAECRQLIGRQCALIVAALVPGPTASMQSLTARLTSREGSCVDYRFRHEALLIDVTFRVRRSPR